MNSDQPPAWVRSLLALDRAVDIAARAEEMVRDELLEALVPAAQRDRVTRWIYSRQPTYLPGGTRFETGLFDWEAAAIGSAPFPPRGRVLVGAAGAGREARALLQRGYSVVAFEPCAPFVEAARSVRELGEASFTLASYQDLIAALDGAGPLAEVVRGAPFDAVVLGWASLSHVLEESDRTALLRAVRRLAPDAPLLTSFLLAHPVNSQGPLERARARLRSALAFAGTQRDPGLSFQSRSGFAHLFADGEIDRLAADTGYEVARFVAMPHAHALLLPSKP